MPNELRERLGVSFTGDEGDVIWRDIDPEVSAWVSSMRQTGTRFFLGDPFELLHDSEIYDLVMAGATWLEITDFFTERAIAHIEAEGRTVHNLREPGVRIHNGDVTMAERFMEMLPPGSLMGIWQNPNFIPDNEDVASLIDGITEWSATFEAGDVRFVIPDHIDINTLPRLNIDWESSQVLVHQL
jgi:hypothetical protein